MLSQQNKAKWEKIREMLGNLIAEDSFEYHDSKAFDKEIIKFRKPNWGAGMWAGISYNFLDDHSINESINEIKDVEPGYIITNDGIIAKNKF